MTNKYYLVTLRRTNPRGMPAIIVGGQKRKGFTLETSRFVDRKAQMLVDAEYWDAVQLHHSWPIIAPAVVKVEGPFEDAEADVSLHFNGDQTPDEITHQNQIECCRSMAMLAALEKSSLEHAPVIRRARRALAQGAAPELHTHVWGRIECTDPNGAFAPPEKPEDSGFSHAEVWYRLPQRGVVGFTSGAGQ